MPGSLADLRVRLEGQLEVAEEAVEAMGRGVLAAREGDFGPLHLAMKMDLTAAWAHLERRAGSEPAVQALRSRWNRLREEAAERVRERAKQLMLPERPPLASLEALLAEPLSYEGRARPPLGLAVGLGLGGLGLFLLMDERRWWGMVGVLAAAWAAAQFAFAPRLIVTTQRLIVGSRAFELRDIASVTVRAGRRRGAGTLVVGLVNGEAELPMAHTPEAFLRALRQAGIRVGTEL